MSIGGEASWEAGHRDLGGLAMTDINVARFACNRQSEAQHPRSVLHCARSKDGAWVRVEAMPLCRSQLDIDESSHVIFRT